MSIPYYTANQLDDISLVETSLDDIRQDARVLLRRLRAIDGIVPDEEVSGLETFIESLAHGVRARLCQSCHQRLVSVTSDGRRRCYECWWRHQPQMVGPDEDRAYADMAGK